MNSLDKKIKKSSLPIKKNELLLSSNNISNNLIKQNLNNHTAHKNNAGVKNEDSSLGKNKYEESKKSFNIKRETSNSNSSNRIQNNYKKENNIINLNKYLNKNANPSILLNVKKVEIEKNHHLQYSIIFALLSILSTL